MKGDSEKKKGKDLKKEITMLEKAIQSFDKSEEELKKKIKRMEKMKKSRRLRYIILGAMAAMAVVFLGLSFIFHEKPVPYSENKSDYMKLEVMQLLDNVGGSGVNQFFTFLTPDGTTGYICFSDKEKAKVKKALFDLDNETVTQTFYGTMERRERTYSLPSIKTPVDPYAVYSAPGPKTTYCRTYEVFNAKTTDFRPQQRLSGIGGLFIFVAFITLMYYFVVWDTSGTARENLDTLYKFRLEDILYARIKYNKLTGSKTLDIPSYAYSDGDVYKMRRIGHFFAPEFAKLPLFYNGFQEELTALSPVVDLGPLRVFVEAIWSDYEKERAEGTLRGETKEDIANGIYVATATITLVMNDLLGATKTSRVEEKVAAASDVELIKAWTLLGNHILFASGKLNIENIISFRNYLYHCFEERRTQQNEEKAVAEPIAIKGTEVHFHPDALIDWKCNHLNEDVYEKNEAILLSEKTPTICVYGNDQLVRSFCLQTEDEEDFSGKYFHISVRMHFTQSQNESSFIAFQIDGFISDTEEECAMTLQDIGYRMEGFCLSCNGAEETESYEQVRGRDLVSKGLKYPGSTTPSNVRLIGICPECKRSFTFYGYAFYMVQEDVAYSDDGLDVCRITEYEIDKDIWTRTVDGKTFRYYNSFNCPHCGTPYIDYKKYPEMKQFGVSGCALLGKKVYTDTDGVADENHSPAT